MEIFKKVEFNAYSIEITKGGELMMVIPNQNLILGYIR
jgi:hypothetical protein